MALGTIHFTTPRDADLGLHRLKSESGIAVEVLPGGQLFAITHADHCGSVMINQILGSTLAAGIGRILLWVDGETATLVGQGARGRFAAGEKSVRWADRIGPVEAEVRLWPDPALKSWYWRIEVTNRSSTPVGVDAVLLQDLGLAVRGGLMNNEAFASQYTDQHIETDSRLGHVVMSRQALPQDRRNPWVAHGCLEGARSFATDGLQLFGPAFREAPQSALDGTLPSERLQHEVACVALGTETVRLAPGADTAWTFFGRFEPHHPAASGTADLGLLAGLENAKAPTDEPIWTEISQSLVERAQPLQVQDLTADELGVLYPERRHEERDANGLLSFFAGSGAGSRHVVLRHKELQIRRRHGSLVRSGRALLPDDGTLCATFWMHGVFGAQLTLGNTSFHKLFSVSRDPYNITRNSGLRMMVDIGTGWQLLTVPSAFDMGLSDARWIYRTADRTIEVRAAMGEDAALLWSVTVDGAACRFLVYGHLVLGERELDHAAKVTIDTDREKATFCPDPDWLWGQRYPEARFHLVTGTPGIVEDMGGDELLFPDGRSRGGGYIAFWTAPTAEFRFAVVGSMTDAEEADRLARKYAGAVDIETVIRSATAFWSHLTRDVSLGGARPGVQAVDTILPWFVHDAVIHLSVPHGLEQYSGAAWGTRDVCQGSVEALLAFGHDATVKDILRVVFAQQYEKRGDWPQWFMLEPYSFIQDRHAHGDVIVWPLKALCDYLEATGDSAFLDEQVQWRGDDDLVRTERTDTVAVHIEKMLATVKERSVPGTNLLCYGEGDWNDSLQPADPTMRDRMVSSWTVVLLWQQLGRYAEALRRAGRGTTAGEVTALAATIRADIDRLLIRDGVIAGYAWFKEDGAPPELVVHPSDRRTGLKYSLLPMTRSLIAGLFAPEQAAAHLDIIRRELEYPDGVRLLDRPVHYRGGIETVFRRAESAAFFGREIGLMYVHSHLRYAEAMATLRDSDAFWDAMLAVNPIAVTDLLPQATLRQRNCYFTSSDAAFPDRYVAEAEWDRVRAGTMPVDGGWRVYSSGPGLYLRLVLDIGLGRRRYYGERVAAPLIIPGDCEVKQSSLTS
ncbi:MAG: hypothetical protein U1E45_21380 [Geminicoccaceae bacterium]